MLNQDAPQLIDKRPTRYATVSKLQVPYLLACVVGKVLDWLSERWGRLHRRATSWLLFHIP